jgi:hypothetical protein
LLLSNWPRGYPRPISNLGLFDFGGLSRKIVNILKRQQAFNAEMIQIKIKSSAKKPYESGLSTTVGLILNRTKGVRIEERTNPEPSSSSLLGLPSLL